LRTHLIAALAALFVALHAPAAPLLAQASPPKLVVFVVVDQLRGDYLTMYGDLMEHGLKRLMKDGAWFRNGAYPYLSTITCVGHATIGTGTLPYKHGMINNAWFDRATAKSVTCSADPDSTSVSYATSQGAGDSAVRMMVPTLADVMRKSLNSRVATMSMKARSAIALAGHGGDFVTWFGDRNAWETSTAFSAAPVGWFAGYLKGNPIEGDSDKTWERTLPPNRYQFSDDGAGERGASGWSAVFPHPLGKAGDNAYLQHWLQSPYPNDYLERMAEAAVTELKLGLEDRTDFLGVSFSSLDSVGHAFGPRSHEVQDTLVRLDATLGRFLDFLDEKVGKGNYVLAFSADHGVADIPEQVPGGGRATMLAIRTAIESLLKPALGSEGPFIAATAGGEIYFRPGVWDRIESDRALLQSIRKAVGNMSGIARVIAADEISTAAARTAKDTQIRAAALSYFPDRSGDLIVVPKENWLLTGAGTTHGSWYSYDQRVPVLLFGAGIQPGARNDAATPADLAPTVASIVGVTLPSPDGRVLTPALKKR
jgi:predicted AlkP superfamily pyrophosphatase or phosphodiesterase